ncbi:MAG: phosphoglucosamine mutase [Firmicutes bacterium]|nr:phosphoglucosamine mutase [Bacillota bacterium]
MGRFFGTDGVRGVANQDLTPELAFQLGRVGAYVLAQKKGQAAGNGRLLVGRDTRVSGEMLEAALVAGITSTGVQVELLGVLPTPGVAYLTRKLKAEAGVMISASHNPVGDNGIKFFDENGYKLDDDLEAEIESFLTAEERGNEIPRPVGLAVGRVLPQTAVAEEYAKFLVATAGRSFAGVTVVLDCAFGATYQIAPKVFAELGAKVIALHAEDDGSRINVRCGSTHPGLLQEEVVRRGAQIGFAYDGDGDRVIAVDEKGELVDGDQIMGICGFQLLADGRLPHQTIAVTVYSNLGLLEAFREAGGDVVVTENGDRKVLAAMLEKGLALGGEQSGHIIFLEHNSTGDGILTSLQLMNAFLRSGQPVSELKKKVRKFPQVLRNVPVTRKNEWKKNERIHEVIDRLQEGLGEKGRIFVRASGTEPLIRVMVEGPDEQEIRKIVDEIAKVIAEELA